MTHGGKSRRRLLLYKEQIPGLENQQRTRKLVIENKKIVEVISVMLTFSHNNFAKKELNYLNG